MISGWFVAADGMRRLATSCACAVLCAGFVGLSAVAAPPAVEAVDDRGARIVLVHPARRIVSLAPHLTEILYAARAGDYVVGAVDFSDYPPPARRLPRVGSYAQFDMEAILRLKPDLVVAWGSGNPAGQVEQLRRLGLTVFVSEPRRLEDIAATLERLGRLADREADARRAARAFRERIERLRADYAGRPAVTVFFEFWHQPLMTVNGEHVISDVIRLCGGRNVFADLAVLAPAVDEEAVLIADPEAIVVSGSEGREAGRFDTWRRHAPLTAVRRGNLYWLPPDAILRHTPRILDGAERLCADLAAARARRD